MGVKKIISGGQTGADQAALHFANDHGIDHGGWCPPGRLCEDGIIDKQFKLKETPVERSENAPDVPRSLRTEWNIRDSDGTLILTRVEDLGTKWTQEAAILYQKPFLVIDPFDDNRIEEVRNWLNRKEIEILNVAGPSEKICPGIDAAVAAFLKMVLLNSKM